MHLIHMPSHIDVLIGDYRGAVASNTRALVADNRALNWGEGGTQAPIKRVTSLTIVICWCMPEF
jgi:hypothetical protein